MSHDLEGFRKLMQFHLQRMHKRLEVKKNEEIGLAGFFNVFNISEKGIEEVNSLNREYYVKLTNLIQKHKDHGTIVVTALSAIMDASIPES